MDLFTYLMSKKGYNYLPHKDLFSYLLGKNNSIPKTSTGSELTINSLKQKLVSINFSKESTQVGTPTPTNPVAINVVKGYTNLFDKANANVFNGYINQSADATNFISSNNFTSIYIPIISGETYTVTKIASKVFRLATSENIPVTNGTWTNRKVANTGTSLTITAGASDNYLTVSCYNSNTDTLTEQAIIDSLMIVNGSDTLPYGSYGNTYISLNISNGDITNQYAIPLNNNELVGTNNYFDKLLIDETGHIYINKIFPKKTYDGTEAGYSSFREKTNTIYWECSQSIFEGAASSSTEPIGLCNRLVKETGNRLYSNEIEGFTFTSTRFRFSLDKTIATDTDNLKTWIGNNNLIVYGLSKTEELIDLETSIDIELFKGTNIITNSENAVMTINYY